MFEKFRGITKVMSFVIFDSYGNCRKLADGIIISLMRYHKENVHQPTYSSTINRTFLDEVGGVSHPSDSTKCKYRITIFKCDGNHGSMISPSQNDAFMDIVTNDELLDIMRKYVYEKNKK